MNLTTGRLAWTWGSTSMKGTRVLLLAASLVHLMVAAAAANHFKVDSVTVSATPNTYTGKCPTIFIKVWGEIKVSGTRDWAGHPFSGQTVHYTFIRSDGKPDFDRQVLFPPTVGDFNAKSVVLGLPVNPDVPFFSITGDPGSSTKGWVAVKILSPNQMESEKANYELNCLAPPDPPKLVKKPDLMCSVAAYKDAANTEPIAGGGSVTFSGPSPKVYFVATLQNVGDADVLQKSFESSVQYKFNGKGMGNPKFTIQGPVPVGQTRMFGVSAMAVPGGTTTMEVTGIVDSKNQVTEANNDNNQCKLYFTTKLPPQVIKEKVKPSEVPFTPPRR